MGDLQSAGTGEPGGSAPPGPSPDTDPGEYPTDPARRVEQEALVARLRARKERLGTRLSADAILGHGDADRR